MISLERIANVEKTGAPEALCGFYAVGISTVLPPATSARLWRGDC